MKNPDEMNEMRAIHVVFTSTEAMVLMEALTLYPLQVQIIAPPSAESTRKLQACQTLMEKLGNQLFKGKGK